MTQEELIAFCGIKCLECPAYIEKRTDDMELREKTAKAWSGPEDFRFCKECGSKHHIEAKFCTNCGKSV